MLIIYYSCSMIYRIEATFIAHKNIPIHNPIYHYLNALKKPLQNKTG